MHSGSKTETGNRTEAALPAEQSLQEYIPSCPPKAQASTALTPLTPDELKKRKQTTGEVAFDWGVYKGIGFGVNEGLSLYLTDEFEHGWGKKYFDRLSEHLAESGYFKATVIDGIEKASARANANNMLMTLGLLTGGTLLLAPMKWLEDSKEKWVRKLNHLFDGGKLATEETEKRDAEVAHAIACEPKQSWASLLLARVAAVSSTVGFGYMMGDARNNSVKNWSENAVDTVSRSAGLGPLPQQGRARRYARLAGVETIYCAISSAVLEASSKMISAFFASRSHHVKNPELCPELETDEKGNHPVPVAAAAHAPAKEAAPPVPAETPSPVMQVEHKHEKHGKHGRDHRVKTEKFTDLTTMESSITPLGMGA